MLEIVPIVEKYIEGKITNGYEDLRDLGLDSMASIKLLLELEEVFGVIFPDEYLVADTFKNTITLYERLTELIESADSSCKGKIHNE